MKQENEILRGQMYYAGLDPVDTLLPGKTRPAAG